MFGRRDKRGRGAGRRGRRGETPLDARRRALAAEEARLRAREAELNRVIAEYPEKAEELARLRREELVRGKRVRGREYAIRVRVDDDRYGRRVAEGRRRPVRKGQRQAAILTFVILCCVLAALVAFLVVRRPAF